MNICILTTWNSACGIAEYSKNLVNELKMLDHHIMILSNKDGYIQGKTYDDTYIFSTKVFGVSWWGEDSNFDADKAIDMMNYFEKSLGPIDVLIVQYQSSLYADSGFNKFLAGVKCPILVLRHDSSVNSKHKFPDRTINIVHNKNIKHDFYIPFPTIELTPKVFSFGMGRNDYEFIGKACKEIGVDFEGHDARKDGWLPEDILFEKMNDADAIVLWYNEVGIEGQSAALRTAISSCRPTIVNDVGWFKDAPYFVEKVMPGKDAKLGLQMMLRTILHLDYIRENSFKECAKEYVRIINETKENK
jgi:hypothetical protein